MEKTILQWGMMTWFRGRSLRWRDVHVIGVEQEGQSI